MRVGIGANQTVSYQLDKSVPVGAANMQWFPDRMVIVMLNSPVSLMITVSNAMQPEN